MCDKDAVFVIEKCDQCPFLRKTYGNSYVDLWCIESERRVYSGPSESVGSEADALRLLMDTCPNKDKSKLFKWPK